MSFIPDRCPTCDCTLPVRSPTSPDVRYCQDHWWEEQLRRFDADEPIDDGVRLWFTTPRADESTAQWRGVRVGK